jgi:ceramide glucosyltransferase
MADLLIVALLGLWLVSAAVGLFGVGFFVYQTRRFARAARRFALPDPPPQAAVILPIKGVPPYLRDCLAGMLAQDYPRLRLILVVGGSDDPAYPVAAEAKARDERVALVVAGHAERRGQKMHNLLAGIAALTPEDEIVCFADADALWPPDTLSELVRELVAWGGTLLLSGYRWTYPARSKPGAVLAAAAGLPVAAIAKAPAWDLAWGGTMAMTRAALALVDPAKLLDRSISDDVPLSRWFRRHGWVKLMPNLVLASPADFTLAGALNFARRQYAMVRLYSPRHWLFSLGVYTILFAGVAASIAAFALPAAPIARAMALAAWTLALARGAIHAAVAMRVLPPAARARMAAVCVLDTLLPVVPALLHAYGLASTIRIRRIRWAGITYTIHGRDVARVERG